MRVGVRVRICCARLIQRRRGRSRGFWKGCKPNSVCRGRANTRSGENHLSERPVPGIRAAVAALARAAPSIPYLALLPMGFSVPRRFPGGRWALTPPFHPCRGPLPEPRRFDFLWHCPSAAAYAAAARVYPAACPARAGGCRLRGIAPCGVRTFLPRRARARQERFSALPEPTGR